MTKAEIQGTLESNIKLRKKAIEDEHKKIIDKFKEGSTFEEERCP